MTESEEKEQLRIINQRFLGKIGVIGSALVAYQTYKNGGSFADWVTILFVFLVSAWPLIAYKKVYIEDDTEN